MNEIQRVGLTMQYVIKFSEFYRLLVAKLYIVLVMAGACAVNFLIVPKPLSPKRECVDFIN